MKHAIWPSRLLSKIKSRELSPDLTSTSHWSEHASYRPDLLPSLDLMKKEHIEILEDWYTWSVEWAVLLRAFAQLRNSSAVLEIGCGLGRIAYGLRDYLALGGGTYDGFDISKYKIDFLQATLARAYQNFRFIYADIKNTTYNPGGAIPGSQFEFPYPDASFDVIYAASVFTHMLPNTAAQYLKESARVLRPGGRGLFSFFLLDYYCPGQQRPFSFQKSYFNLDHQFDDYGREFAVAQPENPEDMTGFRLSLIERLAASAGLRLERAPLPGLWSGSFDHWYGAQDMVIFVKG